MLQKCEHNGRYICGVSFPGFIRGIGMNNDDFIYVLCSGTNSTVVKVDRDLNPLQKSKNSKYLSSSYGMLVTSDHVFATSFTAKTICILDLNLNHQFYLESSLHPYGIATDGSKYFVTFEAAIEVIDIHFEDKKYTSKKIECMRMANGKVEHFKAEIKLRGICVSNHYIFVTEGKKRGGVGGRRLLCLQYKEGGMLEMVAAQDTFNNCNKDCLEECCPVVVVPHGNCVYYTQGSYNKPFHIIRVTMEGTSIVSSIVFDVS